MSDKYDKRVVKHYKIQTDVLWELMMIAQRLCPDGEWVFQMFAHQEWENGKPKKLFMATVTNGDDNVTALSENPGAAVAKLIYHLLDGSVFPLTGNGGVKFFPADTGWVKTSDAHNISDYSEEEFVVSADEYREFMNWANDNKEEKL